MSLKPTANPDGSYYGPEADAVVFRHLGEYGIEEIRRLAADKTDGPRSDLYWQLVSLLDSTARRAARICESLSRWTKGASDEFAGAGRQITAGHSIEDVVGKFRDLPLLAAHHADAMDQLDRVAAAVAASHRAAQQLTG